MEAPDPCGMLLDAINALSAHDMSDVFGREYWVYPYRWCAWGVAGTAVTEG